MDHESFVDLLFPELDGMEDWDCLPSSPSSRVQSWSDYFTSSSSSSELDKLISDQQETPTYVSAPKLSHISSLLHSFSSQTKVPDTFRSPYDHGVVACSVESIIGKRSHEAAFGIGDSAACLCPSLNDSTASPSLLQANCNGCFQQKVSSSVTSMRTACLRSAGISERELHIHSERQRRKTMRESFTILQSLIPNLSNLKQTNRITVLTEVMEYITRLKGNLQDLEKKKSEVMGQLGISDDEALLLGATACSPGGSKDGSCSPVGTDGANNAEVVVRVRGDSVFVTVRCGAMKTKKKKKEEVGVLPALLLLLQSCHVDVVNATMTTCADTSFYSIHGTVGDGVKMDGTKLQSKIRRVIAPS